MHLRWVGKRRQVGFVTAPRPCSCCGISAAFVFFMCMCSQVVTADLLVALVRRLHARDSGAGYSGNIVLPNLCSLTSSAASYLSNYFQSMDPSARLASCKATLELSQVLQGHTHTGTHTHTH
jgi:hypothetical protein